MLRNGGGAVAGNGGYVGFWDKKRNDGGGVGGGPVVGGPIGGGFVPWNRNIVGGFGPYNNNGALDGSFGLQNRNGSFDGGGNMNWNMSKVCSGPVAS